MMHLMNKEELADYMKVRIGTVKYLLYQNKIPKIRVGREYRFDRDDIDQWLHAR